MRLSVMGMMAAVLFVGLGFAALTHPSELWSSLAFTFSWTDATRRDNRGDFQPGSIAGILGGFHAAGLVMPRLEVHPVAWPIVRCPCPLPETTRAPHSCIAYAARSWNHPAILSSVTSCKAEPNAA